MSLIPHAVQCEEGKIDTGSSGDPVTPRGLVRETGRTTVSHRELVRETARSRGSGHQRAAGEPVAAQLSSVLVLCAELNGSPNR